MYHKIVVPLDGSKLAEIVIPHVEAMAQGCGPSEVVLTTVTETGSLQARLLEPGQSPGGTSPAGDCPGVPDTADSRQKEARVYLAAMAQGLANKGIQARTRILRGRPAEEIASFAERESADLIIMATHGGSGISRWALGSVSDKVVRASDVPVLLVRVPGSQPMVGV